MMKTYKYIGMVMMAAGVLAATSCTDYADYNEAVADSNPAGDKTLWENLQQNPNLSDFTALVRKSGFSEQLNSASYYTVWAPVNGQFNKAEYEAMNQTDLLHKFVKNHIAEFSHSATGKLDDDNRVLMLNNKSYDFVGMGTYLFDNLTVEQANLPASNGLIHTLRGAAPFYPSLYEFVTDSVEAAKLGLDSLSAYFRSKETIYLDEQNSVKGPIVNGKVTYLDSVIIKRNSLTNRLNTQFENEDSSYTFILPTNSAWEKAYTAADTCYKYIATTKAEKFVDQAGTISISADPATKEINASEWRDSLAHSYLINYLTYSNNDAYNKWLTSGAAVEDTLRTTRRTKLSGAADILNAKVQTVNMSNGTGIVVNDLNFRSWETYEPERTIRPYRNPEVARVLSGTARREDVEHPDTSKVFVEEGTFSYVWVQAPSQYAKPELDLYLTDVKSTTYDFYCVFVPQNVELGDTTTTLPNRVIFTLSYCDEAGELKTHEFLDESEENINSFQERFNLKDNTSNRTTIRAFSNDTSKVDTLYLGEFTFPVCYYGLSDESKQEYICPNLKITSPFSVFNAGMRAAFSRDFRIAAIILKPKKLVEYEKSNK